jgi:phage baseplate assembly protein V
VVKVRNLIRRAFVSLVGGDTDAAPLTQINSRGIASDSEVMEPYGYHYQPPVDSLGLVFLVEGHEEAKVTMAYAPNLRPTGLKSGEVVLGNFAQSATIYFDQSGKITVNAPGDVDVISATAVNVTAPEVTITASTSVTIDSPDVTITGDLTVEGATALSDTVTSDGTNISNTHTHSGVTAGGGTSGPPV